MDVQGLHEAVLHFQRHAVAGIEIGDIMAGEVLRRGGGAVIVFKEMEAAQHAEYAVIAADGLSLLDDVADTAVGAACDDEEALLRTIGQRRIVQEVILLPLTHALPLANDGAAPSREESARVCPQRDEG